MFSVLIITLNEEKNLPSCLASVSPCNDVVVLDSGSTDRTAEIARAAGARVVVRPFTNFADQRNFGHTGITWKNSWIFHLDADEQMTPELVAECAGISVDDPSLDGFYSAPRMFFHKRWIRHSTDFPAYQARLGHVRRFRFFQVGHGQRELPGLHMGKLTFNYLHDLSSQSDLELENKHRRYARDEAHAFLSRPPSTKPLFWRVCSTDPLVRRRALKELSQQLPARAFLRFVYQYLWRRGFLDGRPGLAYCLLLSRYEGWIAQEIRRQRRNSS